MELVWLVEFFGPRVRFGHATTVENGVGYDHAVCLDWSDGEYTALDTLSYAMPFHIFWRIQTSLNLFECFVFCGHASYSFHVIPRISK
ncbi:hypothetical protein AVEN_234208-1 [Araneus ventricosus]|uniref:Uncharacterized protein n=1 Tax=Araneus ventricosus TaxID=182803 RepID=A0A4Y2A843_ARAVE|nr:hypothetical protein AVEN_234208-1 [Araneus ventricosus]